MKKLLLLLLSLCSPQIFAQISELSTSNPAPRIGDEIEITISLKKKDLSHLAEKDKLSLDEIDQISNNRIGHGKMSFTDYAVKEGSMVIGPFTFSINGQNFKTDSTTITVYPELPKDEKEGVWIRYIQSSDKNYLIIEQRVKGSWEVNRQSNSISFSNNTGDSIFLELNQDEFESMGLNIVSSSTSSKSQVIDEDDIMGNGTVSYKISTYTFEKTANFKGKFKLTKKMLNSAPDNFKLEKIWIE